mmetsp:Transcript_5768/g.21815  ORF Transcript_5768/g.21815 Transcript_5768/m.21815 type:complete len:82 (+) Transcript_5768:2543-2788(+)
MFHLWIHKPLDEGDVWCPFDRQLHRLFPWCGEEEIDIIDRIIWMLNALKFSVFALIRRIVEILKIRKAYKELGVDKKAFIV